MPGCSCLRLVGQVIFWLLALTYLVLGAGARAALHIVGGAVIFWAPPAFLIWLVGREVGPAATGCGPYLADRA